MEFLHRNSEPQRAKVPRKERKVLKYIFAFFAETVRLNVRLSSRRSLTSKPLRSLRLNKKMNLNCVTHILLAKNVSKR